MSCLRTLIQGAMSSMEKVLNDGDVMSIITSKLQSPQDLYAASMVCKIWYDSVSSQASKLVLQTRLSLPHLVKAPKHILVLDLSCLTDELEDRDLKLCANSFPFLRSFSLGDAEEPYQNRITNIGILAIAKKCSDLENLSLIHIQGMKDAEVWAFGTGCPRLHSFTLGSCWRLTDSAVDAICEFPALVELQMFGTFPSITAPGLAKVGFGCKKLLKIRLALKSQLAHSGGDIRIQLALEALAKGCPELREISLGPTISNFRALAECKSLTSLTLEGPVEGYHIDELDNQVLSVCMANPNLKELAVMDSRASLSSHAVMRIMECVSLEKLDLAAGYELSESTIRHIASKRTLRSLRLDEVVPQPGLQARTGDIGRCSTEMKSLVLRNCSIVGNRVLKALLALNRGLEKLDLSSTTRSADCKGFPAIAACKNLQVLNLSYTNVNDDNLVAIAKEVPALKQLSLINCTKVSSMKSVVRFTRLETLHISACPFVCDLSLELLPSHCPRLLHLDISHTGVSDEGLNHLCRFTLLRSLRVVSCKSIQGSGLVHVARACLLLQRITISDKFYFSRIAEELKNLLGGVLLECDTD